jgi:calcineurin-like phosphoesterase family protein
MLNFRETEEQKIYVTADLHLGHQQKFVWESRGFESHEAHTDGVIGIINNIVRPTDILLCLGDFCLNTTIEQFNEYLGKIQCKNILMCWGNHNNPHYKRIYKPLLKTMLGESYTEETELYPVKYNNLTFIGHYAEIILNGHFIVLFHYPIYVWNEMQNGSWMLCGHSHNGCGLTKAENVYGKILDVSWDGHGKPWSLEEIMPVMENKRFLAVDHHHKEATPPIKM